MLFLVGLLLWILLCIVIVVAASYAAIDTPVAKSKNQSNAKDPFSYLFPL